MTRIGAITESLNSITNELAQVEQAQMLSEPSLASFGPTVDSSAYVIGQHDRSNDAIYDVAHWADGQRADDAMKVFYLTLNKS